ncbi:hypothetical protein BCR44DRAFT_359972 [Catenaria anguillulae PL171]|uniref:Uncharacterized protein n=1 Tax=Catenaria anguillulae PL171 TaxID=765915 RepID=A0A1Y2I0W9_9FUNG|nr:hypothetical protein BCR44DRAFT_359972 [Catenaria anguillulae PL171]
MVRPVHVLCAVDCQRPNAPSDPTSTTQPPQKTTETHQCNKPGCICRHASFQAYVRATRHPNMTAKQCRYAIYRHAADLLGYTARQPLPDCVLSVIRAEFPEPDSQYVGYRPA